MSEWRPHRKGECPRRYHEEIEFPVKYAGMVEYVVSLPDNAARGRFLAELRKRQGAELCDRVRKDAWQRLRRVSASGSVY